MMAMGFITISSCEGIKLKKYISIANEVLPEQILTGFTLTSIEYGNGKDEDAKAIVLNIYVSEYLSDAFILSYSDWISAERVENHILAISYAMYIPEVKDVVTLAMERKYNTIVKMHYKIHDDIYYCVEL